MIEELGGPVLRVLLRAIGWILVEQGDHARALKYLRDAQARSGTNPLVRYHLAVVLNELGKSDEARRELEGLLKSDQEFDGIVEARALFDRLSGG